jgi:hypothetical protein
VSEDQTAQDSFPYPGGNVIGGLPDEAAFASARESLEQSGFGPDRYQVLHGQDDAMRIDVTGETHGWTGTVIRKLQAVMSDEAEITRSYAEYVREGHYLVAVSVGDDDNAKRLATDALHAADAQFLTYFSAHTIEDLGGTG